MNFLHKKYGFTLSEVLITIGVIGAIGALTIPTLMYNYRGKVLEQQYRSTYSDIKEIGSRLNYEQGDVGAYANKLSIQDWTNAFLSYIPGGGSYNKEANCETNINTTLQKIYKDGGGGGGPYRFSRKNGKDKTLMFCDNNGIWSDAKGRLWAFNAEHRIVCVDINGTSPPNTYNIDIFAFIPMNAYQVGTWVYDDPDNAQNYSGQIVPCDADKLIVEDLSNKTIGRDCPAPGTKGDGCALDACPFMEPVENIAVMTKDNTGKIIGNGTSAMGKVVTTKNDYWHDYINYK